MKLKFVPLLSSLIMINSVSAATLVDLNNKPLSYLKNVMAKQQSFVGNSTGFTKIRSDIDFNKTSHTRLRQTYAGFPVWNASAIVHTPDRSQAAMISAEASTQGKVYEGLEQDLAKTPAFALSDAQKQKALSQAKMMFEKKSKVTGVPYQKESVKTIVYVDQKHVAHYAYLVSFYVDDENVTGPHLPNMIMDAVTLNVYRSWDRVMNLNSHFAALKQSIPGFKSSYKLQEILREKFGTLRIKFLDGDGDDGDDTGKDESDKVPGEEGNILDEFELPFSFSMVEVGGIGGNEKVGLKMYDGTTYPTFEMLQIKLKVDLFGQPVQMPICLFMNKDAIITDASYKGFDAFLINPCYVVKGKHNDVTWLPQDKDGTRWESDEMNGGYSPSFDVMYGLYIARKVYEDWYKTPLFYDEKTKESTPFPVNVHYGRKYENAFWNGDSINFGDGDKRFYPLTSLDVVMHEISHAFTEQRSGIDISYPQMAALHEAFSDMAAMAAQYYVTGKNTWDLGRDVRKVEGALRYLDDPTKDAKSIDHMKDYDDDLDCHAANGVFNKAFYNLATTPGWTVKKAFDIMVKANMHYWDESMVTYEEAACGVVNAAKDYKYRLDDVRVAFSNVGIDTSGCR